MNSQKNSALHIFAACLIPNIGGWIFYGIVFLKIKENDTNSQIEPSYAPPGWVSFGELSDY
jgi:hypothetical protein